VPPRVKRAWRFIWGDGRHLAVSGQKKGPQVWTCRPSII